MDTTLQPPSKPAETAHAVHPLIRQRYSPRLFDAARSISREELLSLFEAARWAPSSYNEQPWRFMLATREDEIAFERMMAGLKRGNQRWARHAAALVYVLARTNRIRDEQPNAHAWHDVGLAVGSITFEATARDIYLRQMGGIHRDIIRKEFAIPAEFAIVSAIALGYRGHIEKAEPELAERELRPRTRRPLAETLFTTEWGTPFST